MNRRSTEGSDRRAKVYRQHEASEDEWLRVQAETGLVPEEWQGVWREEWLRVQTVEVEPESLESRL